MLIDIHTHIAPENALARALARNPISPSSKPRMTPAQMVARMDAYGIDKAVLLAGVSPECRIHFVTPEEVLQAWQAFPDRFIPFANVDPRMVTNGPATDFGPVLQFYKDAGCRGVGEYTPNLPFDDPLNLNVFAHVEAIGLPLTFHIGPTRGGCYGCYDELGLPRLEKVLRQFPGLTFLAHSQPFWAEIGADLTEDARNTYPKGKVTPGRVVELLRAFPNLYGDLSAGSGFNAISRDPEFGDGFLEEFQDRLLFGTDLLWPGQEAPLVAYFNTLKRDGRISEEAWEKIAWRNADRVLGLGLQRAKEETT